MHCLILDMDVIFDYYEFYTHLLEVFGMARGFSSQEPGSFHHVSWAALGCRTPSAGGRHLPTV